MDSHNILIDDISLMSEGEEKTQVIVKLKLGDSLGCGEETGTNSNEEILKLIALATIKAVNSLLPRPMDLKIDHIKTFSSSNNTSSIKTLICLKKPDKNIFLNGSFPIADDCNKAAANAVLQTLKNPIESELKANKFRKKISANSQNFTEIFGSLAQSDPSLNVSEFSSETLTNFSNDDLIDMSLNASRAENLANQAKIASMKGNYEQAAFCYKQAINFNPLNSSYYYQLVLVLHNLPNQSKEIENALLKAIELTPKEISYHLELGFLYKQIGLSEKASTQFKEILTIDSNNEVAKQMVQELSKERLELSLAPINKSAFLSSQTRLSKKSKEALSLSVSYRVIAISLAIMIGFVSLCLASLYIINLPSSNHKAVAYPKNKEQLKALKLVQNYPSITSGLSIKEYSAKIIKEQKITSFEWSASQEKNKKNSKEYLVIFFFKKDDKNQYAIWSVDTKEWKVKCRNTIAESFTKL
ncbi:MAG: hypothetical protein HY819_01815 [Acidobacteria bacterium]|nr:hypothetical protein [Acidobacteriota bacterium]